MTDFKAAPIKPTIAFEDFEKIDIRVGTIRRVEDVAGADKLARLIVDFGDHTRTILRGLRRSGKTPVRSKAGRPCSW